MQERRAAKMEKHLHTPVAFFRIVLLLQLTCRGMDRDSLTTKHATLTKELEQLRQELAAYSEQDPIEVDKKKHEAQQYQGEVDKYTDQILSMEGWLKERLSGDAEQVMQTKRLLYGDEFDEEEGGLREL
ncbi:hypothetical protein PMIN02_006786 [Paraphaeosphaeria minitans]